MLEAPPLGDGNQREFRAGQQVSDHLAGIAPIDRGGMDEREQLAIGMAPVGGMETDVYCLGGLQGGEPGTTER